MGAAHLHEKRKKITPVKTNASSFSSFLLVSFLFHFFFFSLSGLLGFTFLGVQFQRAHRESRGGHLHGVRGKQQGVAKKPAAYSAGKTGAAGGTP